MCYAAPGPRCSKHASQALTSIVVNNSRYKRENNLSEMPPELAYAAYRAQEDCDATPAGQKYLDAVLVSLSKKKEKSGDDKHHIQEIKERIIKGQALRKAKLDAWKQINSYKTDTNTFTGSGHDMEEDKEYDESLVKESLDGSAFVNDEKFRNVKKMPALFVIDRVAHAATTEINENAAWIFDEPSHPSIKRDGTSITVNEDGTIFARRSVKKGKKAPAGYILAETDPITGHSFGLEPMDQSGYAKMFAQAAGENALEPGTYELCGPKINGNPENLTAPILFPHGSDEAKEIPDMRTVSREKAYELLKDIFADYKKSGVEGVVWKGENGKRTKLRVKDFFGDDQRF